jgi:hypothetical protein
VMNCVDFDFCHICSVLSKRFAGGVERSEAELRSFFR